MPAQLIEQAIAHPGKVSLCLHQEAIKHISALAEPPTRFELLVRLNIGGTLLSAGHFLPAVSLTSPETMERLDWWVLKQAAQKLETSPHSYSVNLSAHTLNKQTIVPQIAALFHGLGAQQRLTLEITERPRLSDQAKINIGQLKRDVCAVWLDDLGEGESSLVSLKQIKPQGFKLDGAIARDVLTDKWARVITIKALAIAEALDLTCVVEFVETDELAQWFVGVHQSLPTLDLHLQGYAIH